MSIIETTLFTYFSKHPEKDILIAYSGGVDSQVLLHALYQLVSENKVVNTLRVIHVNHGLSDNAEHWESFAQQECAKRNVPIYIERVNVENKPQHSLEALARDARYKAIKDTVSDSTIVVTGHHNDDQAETFLLALKRGSGVKGLSSMQRETNLGKAVLARPLLVVSRADIEQYAQDNQLSWIEDESNDDKTFDRNFIRHDVMPVITGRWPSFLKTLNRSTEHCQESSQLLAELALQDLELCNANNTRLSISPLLELSSARFNNVIRFFLEQHDCLMPSRSQLIELRQQLLSDGDKSPAVKVGEHWMRRYREHVYLTPELIDVSNYEQEIAFDDIEESSVNIELPQKLGTLVFSQSKNIDETSITPNKHNILIAPPKVGQSITLSFKHTNPSCLPEYRQKSRPLKKVLQELYIPIWERKRLPFLYYDNELVAVLGHFVCKPYIAKNEEEKIVVSWLLSEE